MRVPKFGMATLLASSLSGTGASAQGAVKAPQPPPSPAYLGSITSPGVASGYGNYWFPSNYPFPSIGGSGYINYGPGGALGTYFSVPATANFPAATPTNKDGATRPTRQSTPSSNRPASSSKPAPIRRKPR